MRRCGKCGSAIAEPTTIAIDWRHEWICDRCVRRLDWSGWIFDPILNTYTRA